MRELHFVALKTNHYTVLRCKPAERSKPAPEIWHSDTISSQGTSRDSTVAGAARYYRIPVKILRKSARESRQWAKKSTKDIEKQC